MIGALVSIIIFVGIVTILIKGLTVLIWAVIGLRIAWYVLMKLFGPRRK